MIGQAVAIAAYGSIFTAAVQHDVRATLPSTVLGVQQQRHIATLISHGDPRQALAAVPAQLRPELVHVIRSSFASTLNDLFLISGILALAGGLCATVLIRSKDFVPSQPDQTAAMNSTKSDAAQ
jgi:hypothetical protein